jgi:hypothetical protein
MCFRQVHDSDIDCDFNQMRNAGVLNFIEEVTGTD